MEEGVAEGDGITAVAAAVEVDTVAVTAAAEVEEDGEASAAASKHSPARALLLAARTEFILKQFSIVVHSYIIPL